MKFVFESKDDMKKTTEFAVFVILSLIGLGLNSVILFICMDLIYRNWTFLNQLLSADLMKLAPKIIATAIVMVYNFVSRKIFLEKKE